MFELIHNIFNIFNCGLNLHMTEKVYFLWLETSGFLGESQNYFILNKSALLNV